jgi:hypothetical protein
LVCKSGRGLTQHQQTLHREFTPVSDNDPDDALFTTRTHPSLNGVIHSYYSETQPDILKATPCDKNGNAIPPYTPPPAPEDTLPNNWAPFGSRAEFNFAHYHFVEVQSSAIKIDKALDMWAASVMEFGADAPWKTSADLYKTIDAIQHGDLPWKTYRIRYQGPRPPGTPPKWMMETYKLYARDTRQVLHHQLATKDFKDKINLVPYRQFNAKGQWIWSNLMSADWAWSQAVRTVFANS